jgi:hypothetical protein
MFAYHHRLDLAVSKSQAWERKSQHGWSREQSSHGIINVSVAAKLNIS